MNLSKLIVPMFTGLALSAAVVSVHAQTTRDDTIVAPRLDRGTATTTDLNDTTTDSRLNENNTMNNRVTVVNPAVDEDAASDDQLVARVDRN